MPESARAGCRCISPNILRSGPSCPGVKANENCTQAPVSLSYSLSDCLRFKKVECRLLYLVGHLGSGGLERQLCYLLQAMDRKRYQPAVAVWSFREEDA